MEYRVVLHLDRDDQSSFSLGLGNAANLLKATPGDQCSIVILVNGPAVRLLDRKNCPYAGRISELQMQKVVFRVCNNALNTFGVAAEDLPAGCRLVPAGIVELIALQQKGYAYIKP